MSLECLLRCSDDSPRIICRREATREVGKGHAVGAVFLLMNLGWIEHGAILRGFLFRHGKKYIWRRVRRASEVSEVSSLASSPRSLATSVRVLHSESLLQFDQVFAPDLQHEDVYIFSASALTCAR